jgi:3-oxoacyl-[acyl-carrier-protein] synthase-1
MAEAPLANTEGEAITMGFVPTLDGRLVGAERLAALARAPFEEAISLIRDLEAEVHIVIDEGCEEAEKATHLLEAMVKRAMPAASVDIEARGETGPVALLPAAIRALETRRTNVVVLGGAHSDFDPRAIAALEASDRLFTPENLDARIPGETAAFLVLMRDTEALRRRLCPLARILGVGTGQERARPDNDDPACEALGLTAAVHQATEPLVRKGWTAGWMLTDLTCEMRRLNEWQSVFVRAQKVLGRPYVIDSPAQRIGYLGAAAMPLFVAIASMAWKHGYAPSDLVLAMVGTDGGARAAMVLGKDGEKGP